ncbi:MAG: homoserine dehydrogenase [Armatimonadetes bacterium]|nr:homoserine dehydrogenase [Armatimonadota bacterium]
MSDQGVIGVGIIGFGIVGQGTYSILRDNAETIERQVGRPVRVVSVADLRTELLKEKLDPNVRASADAEALIRDPDVHIVCELIGGVNPAGRFVRMALEAGKHVVVANKELLAKQGPQLLELAEKNSADFYFEASVGGGIPIISPLRIGLAGNQIEKIIGIVNGTTNYILTRMSGEGGSLEDVLREAQALGYAESDPTNDIEGYDARYKITILASLGFHARLNVDQILCEGISGLKATDVNNARDLGYNIKLLAVAKRTPDGIEARVHPALVPLSHPIASVSGVNNAIFVTGDAVGDIMVYGPGAGGMAAGSAVVGDIVEVSRNIVSGSNGRLKTLEFRDLPVQATGDIVCRYYARMRVEDHPGVLAAIATQFGDCDVSIASMVQKTAEDGVAELVFLTHEVKERDIQEALERIRQLDDVDEICSVIRVEE